MRLIMHKRQDQEIPEVTIAYREITDQVKRVADFVRHADLTVLCRKEEKEYSVPVSEIYYVECVDKKSFVYCRTEVYQSSCRLYELEAMLCPAGFVRVSKSVILNIERMQGVKKLVNSRLEALLSNGERICVTRKYLKDIREALLRRNIG